MADVKELNQFYNQLKDVGTRLTHQYQLSLSNVPAPAGAALEQITLWAEGANLPGRTQNTQDIQYLGYPFNVPTNFTMTNELTCNIRCDSNLEIREALLFWMGIISDPDVGGASASGGIKTASRANAILDLYNDRMDTVTHTYELVGVYPTNIGEIDLSNSEPSIATFGATFKYQFWKTTTSPNGGLLS